jgi:IS66 Orf2 like protein.
MFSLNDSMRYWLYPYPTDMRKGFYTLSGIVRDRMGQDVKTGNVFIFINRLCTGMKILHLEYGGLVIYHMKLESGCFKLPVFDENTRTYRTCWHDLMLMVRGLDSQGKVVRKRWSSPDK